MFIHDPNKTLFEVMKDHDQSSDTEDRCDELRNGVGYYNMHNGTQHVLDSALIRNYWKYLDALGVLIGYRNA